MSIVKLLVLGGASSGKSDIAEKVCLFSGLNRVYLASSQIYDDEMREKATKHRADRGSNWLTIEEPFGAADILKNGKKGEVILFDCATMWLSNHLLAEHDLTVEKSVLLAAIRQSDAMVVIVSNEVGQGIVPENALARKFRIEQGLLNRELAQVCDPVVGVMAGLPFALKGALPKALA